MPAKERRETPDWLMMLVMGAFVLTVPLWIPVALVYVLLHDRRVRRVAESFRCVTCGSALGAAAVRRADKEWKTHVAELRRRQPWAVFRLARTVHAICLACGTHYTWLEDERTFAVVAERTPGSTGAVH